MNPMQPPENQVPGQPPTGAPPGMMPSSINFAAFTAPENRSYLIAAIGSLVALLSFFIFGFWGVSASSTLVGGFTSSSFTGSDAAGTGGYFVLWLVPLAALVVLAIACLLVLGINAVQQITPANGGRYTVIAGVVGLVALVVSAFKINSDVSKFTGGIDSAELARLGVHYSSGLGFGFWLTLLALIAVIVGGVMNMRQVQGVSMSRPAI
jgi:hypothetical protein